MSKSARLYLLHCLTYIGVAIALVPYISSRMNHLELFVAVGLLLAFGSSFVRCVLHRETEHRGAERERLHLPLLS